MPNDTVAGVALGAPAPGNVPAPAENTPGQTVIKPEVINAGAGEGTDGKPLPPLPERPQWLPEKFQKPEDLARSYTELEKKLGSAGAFPKDDAPQAERDAFWNKLGRPETPDKYDLKTPSAEDGWNKDHEGIARQRLHAAGLTQKQVQAAIDLHVDLIGAGVKQIDAGAKETTALLQKEWGGAFETNMNYMVTALRQLGGDDTVRMFTQTPIGNNPTMIRLMAKVGRALGEAGFVDGDAAGESGESLQDQIDGIMSDRTGAYWNTKDPGHQAAVAKVSKLMGALHPNM